MSRLLNLSVPEDASRLRKMLEQRRYHVESILRNEKTRSALRVLVDRGYSPEDIRAAAVELRHENGSAA